ncbi:MAG: MlaD family protein [Pseudomonadota bacterium]
MTDPTPPPPPKVELVKSRRVSLIWLIPLISVGLALSLLWSEYRSRGPVIEIRLATASGLKAGETAIRYRDVEVGRVEELSFAEDLDGVIASVRMSPEVAPYVDDDATFWVVRPEVSAQGISGLETVISGVYIAGDWDAEKGVRQASFEVLDQPPLTSSDTPGKRVKIRAADGGSLSVGAPIFFRRVEVGRIETKRLTADGDAVEFDVFINAPHDQRLTPDTRFWNVSGVDFSFGAEGARMRVGSLVSLLQGGAAFENLSGDTSTVVEKGHVYILYPTERDAREKTLEIDPGKLLLLDVYFEGSVRGLSIGGPVEYQGIRVGRVTGIAAEIDPAASRFATRTTIALSPQRLGLADEDVEGALSFMKRLTANGVRAQLTSGNLFTGALIVRLIQGGALGPDEIEEREGRNPRMPSIPTDLDELAGSVEGVLRRVDALPIEELLDNAVQLLANTNALIGSDGTRALPGNAAAALEALQVLLSDPALARVPGEVETLVASLNTTIDSEAVQGTVRDLAVLASDAAALSTALRENDVAAETAAAIAALRARLEDPALGQLVVSLDQTASALTTLLSNPAWADAPAEVNATLASLRAILDDPGTRAAPEELAAAIGAARSLLDDFKTAGTAIEIAAAASAARELLADPSLRRLSTETADAAAALRTLLAAPGAEDLPASAARAMSSAALLMDEIAAKDLAGATADALAEIEGATAAVRAAAAAAPALIRSLTSTAERADDLLASVQVGSELNYETVTAIREIRDAARAVSDLAQLVERNPSAFILGK